MVNLKEAPFFLSDTDIVWVEETLSHMSVEEKIGQLFIMLDRTKDREEARKLIQEYHIGGCRYENEPAEQIYEQNKFYQECAKIPLLIACNCDSGGNGACSDGTYVASAAACGAAGDDVTAEHVGYVGATEAAAVGCNWNFGPVCDIKKNWRNTVVNTRAFSSDTDRVIKNARAYVRGMRKAGVAVTAKHFPGDGVDELDQHLVMGTNNLSCEEWDESFGRVYRTMIADGVEAVMVGHIALPAYERKFVPEISDVKIVPATLSENLLQKLLRDQLGFNGVIVTDATHMGGFTSSMPRKKQGPGAIAAGCDMFLFFNDVGEDFSYMLQGYRDGVITPGRLDDAVTRILGLKAHLKLHEKARAGELIGAREQLAVIGCQEHKRMAENAAVKSITLVKDSLHQLPVSPKTHRRVYVIVVSNPPITRENREDPVKEQIRCIMTECGYEVTLHDSYYDLTVKHGFSRENMMKSVVIGSVEKFKQKYDAVFMFINISGYAQKNIVRLEWAVKHSTEIPWYVHELPTVIISLNYTNHLIDVPMAKCFINAYAPTEQVLEHLMRKLAGKEAFEGQAEANVFCGRWDTRT